MSFLGIDALVQRWGVHRNTVIREIQRGRLRAVKIGHNWRVSPQSLRAYEEGRSND